MAHDDLRAKARAAIEGGKIPARRPAHVWGGAAAGQPCAICGEPVARFGLELQFSAINGSGPESRYVHPLCFSAFESENRVPGHRE